MSRPYIPDVRTYRDGREHASKREYKARLGRMVERQDGLCAICGEYLSNPTYDHAEGRGMGGGKRCDRIETSDGEWLNAAVCLRCNGAKGSKPYHWLNGSYQPKGATK